MKTCPICKKTEEHTRFYNQKVIKGCVDCERTRMTIYRAKERLLALQAYGGEHPRCACPGCKEDRMEFLAIDHIDGGGGIHRRAMVAQQSKGKKARRDQSPGGGTFFRWLRQNGYPPGYRVLCHNCNMARGNSPCPVHEVQGQKDQTKKEILQSLLTAIRTGKIPLDRILTGPTLGGPTCPGRASLCLR
jgi:hypothetical protein